LCAARLVVRVVIELGELCSPAASSMSHSEQKTESQVSQNNNLLVTCRAHFGTTSRRVPDDIRSRSWFTTKLGGRAAGPAGGMMKTAAQTGQRGLAAPLDNAASAITRAQSRQTVCEQGSSFGERHVAL